MVKTDRDQRIAEGISWFSTVMFVVGGVLQFSVRQYFLGALSVFCASLTIVFRVALNYAKVLYLVQVETQVALRDRAVHEEKMTAIAEQHITSGGSFEVSGQMSSRKKYTN